MLSFCAGSLTGSFGEVITNPPDQVKTMTQAGVPFLPAVSMALHHPFRGAGFAGLRKGIIRGINWGGLAAFMAVFEWAYRKYVLVKTGRKRSISWNNKELEDRTEFVRSEQLQLIADDMAKVPLNLAELDMKRFAEARGWTKLGFAPDWYQRALEVQGLFDGLIREWAQGAFEGDDLNLQKDTGVVMWWKSLHEKMPSFERAAKGTRWLNGDEISKGIDYDVVAEKANGRLTDFYQRIRDLGEGAYGEVFLARQRIQAGSDREHEGRLCAVKRVRKPNVEAGLDEEGADSMEALEEFRVEVELMKALDHPSICRLLQVYEDPKNLYLVMEHIQGGELFEHV
eukprot:symbB.v1.2.028712.t1/scaffold3070.1/size64238/3